MAEAAAHPKLSPGNHDAFMNYALDQARQSPPGLNKYCFGAALVNADTGEILSTGYSLELPRDQPGDPGTTHAEQCCMIEIVERYNPGSGPAED
jgi:tRNA(Arg) A34 adenosine deaminase TadA